MRRLAFFVAAALILATPLRAQEAEALRWSPAKSMEFRVIQQTAVSPDGSLVAFVVRVPVMEGEKSEYLSHIWLANPDGSSVRQFTRGDKSATSPSFCRVPEESSRTGRDRSAWLSPRRSHSSPTRAASGSASPGACSRAFKASMAWPSRRGSSASSPGR